MIKRGLPNVDLDRVGLADVIDFLRDTTQLNVVVQWRTLEVEGIGRDTPVTLQARGVTAGRLLQLVLDAAGDGLTYYVDEGVVTVTTRAAADRVLITRTYDVRDLLLVVPNFPAPDVGFGVANGGRGGAGGNGGNNDFGNDAATRAERAEQLLDLIRRTIRPEIWRENGGPASIRHFRGSLVVTAPPSVHAALGG